MSSRSRRDDHPRPVYVHKRTLYNHDIMDIFIWLIIFVAAIYLIVNHHPWFGGLCLLVCLFGFFGRDE